MVNPHLKLEQKFWAEGNTIVVGIDEAGRGPWAGPVVAGAVCYKKDFEIVTDLNDSKKLTLKKREFLYKTIKTESLAYGIGIVEADEIDKIGLTKAVNKAMLFSIMAIERKLSKDVDQLIIDGSKVSEIENYKQVRNDKADQVNYSVSAASIVAKVTRDRLMIRLSKLYPDYGFENHKGYGTKQHSEALKKYGPTPIHRYSFKPIIEINEVFKKDRR